MGGPRVTPEVWSLVTSTYKRLKKEGKEPIGKEVLYQIEQQLDISNPNNLVIPSLRTIQNIVKEQRKNDLEPSDEEKLLREPWSMASLLKDALPPESIPYVIQVWRYAINTHEEFTIRNARWVSRLYRLFEDTVDLWYYSDWYTEIEKNDVFPDYEPNTFFPDSDTFLSQWETMVLDVTGQWNSISVVSRRSISRHKDGSVIEELLHYIDSWELQRYQLFGDTSDPNTKELFDGITELPSLDSLGFEYETKMVYLRYYTHLIRGPQWTSLPASEALKIIINLRKWVRSEYKIVQKGPSDDFRPMTRMAIPGDLITKVGYELSVEDE